ncbi:MAG: Gx transporter family protein [Oscillospiraceae bacterium]
MILSPIRAKKVSLAGLLGALALILAFIEGSLPPMPLLPPGAKLGLSNIVTMYAASALGLPAALFVALIKGGFALFTRGYAAGMMSICGGVFSAALLALLFRKTRFSCIMIGILGAAAHNLGQLCVAWGLMGEAVLYYIPALIFFGLISGVCTGLIYRGLYPKLNKVIVK